MLQGLTLATSIQRSTSLALCVGLSERSLRQVAMTQFVTQLNWATVARMLGAKCSFPFLSLWDQMLPKQWYGTTFLNSSYGFGVKETREGWKDKRRGGGREGRGK